MITTRRAKAQHDAICSVITHTVCGRLLSHLFFFFFSTTSERFTCNVLPLLFLVTTELKKVQIFRKVSSDIKCFLPPDQSDHVLGVKKENQTMKDKVLEEIRRFVTLNWTYFIVKFFWNIAIKLKITTWLFLGYSLVHKVTFNCIQSSHTSGSSSLDFLLSKIQQIQATFLFHINKNVTPVSTFL